VVHLHCTWELVRVLSNDLAIDGSLLRRMDGSPLMKGRAVSSFELEAGGRSQNAPAILLPDLQALKLPKPTGHCSDCDLNASATKRL
jgi:hypothetical protein